MLLFQTQFTVNNTATLDQLIDIALNGLMEASIQNLKKVIS